MSKHSTSSKSETDWKRLDEMTDDDIDFSDCPEMTSEQFATAVVRRPSIQCDQLPTAVQIDGDILEWFRSQGNGYQEQINGLLRAYMEARN